MACLERTERCINCTDHFEQLFENVKDVIVTKHFIRDAPDFNIDLITGCKNEHFAHLHKFEEKVGKAYIFRAIKENTHFVYAIKDNKIIFLRAFDNFKEYTKFLDDKKQFKKFLNPY